ERGRPARRGRRGRREDDRRGGRQRGRDLPLPDGGRMNRQTMHGLPSRRPMTTAATLLAGTLLAGAAVPAGAAAQDAYLNIRPSVRTDGDVAFGARWEAGIEPERRVTTALSFPREAWWRLNGAGAWLSEAAANTEPVVRADGEAGLLLLLLKQR